MQRFLEWANVATGVVVIASPDSKYRIYRPAAPDPGDVFLRDMSGPGSPASTQALLDGAIHAAWQGPPGADDTERLTLPGIIRDLCADYHSSHATPPTFCMAARGFDAIGRRRLAEFALQKAAEETGHDTLALKDLHALGLPAERVVAAIHPPSAVALTGYFAQCSRAANPVGCFGYSYCLERLASFRGREEVERVRALCAPGSDATRFLRVHSSLGADSGHVEQLADMVASLPAAERVRVAQTSYEAARLMAEKPRLDARLTDDAVRRALASIDVRLPGES